MAIITTGQTFTATGAVTNTKLQDIASKAKFNDPVDGTSLELITLGTNDGKLGIKDAGVTAAKLATDALELARNLAYPVGSIYMNATVATNPATLLGFGTWVEFSTGRVLLGVGEGTDNQPTPEVKTFAAGDALGQYKHTLLEDEMPIHNHRVSMTNDAMETPTTDFSRLGPGHGTTQTNVAKTSVQIINAGGGLAHYNIQPYIAVHMWTRTV
jgi:hypothetical protein